MFVQLTGGQFQIDERDWTRLCGLKWRFTNNGLRSSITRQVVKGGRIQNRCIYHDILGIEPSRRNPVDHINGDPLDNRRCNLRLATPRLNAANRGPQRNNASRYKGVSKTPAGRFSARIKDGVKVRRIGNFATEAEAALAYDAAARAAFGQYAWLNSDHFSELHQDKGHDHVRHSR